MKTILAEGMIKEENSEEKLDEMVEKVQSVLVTQVTTCACFFILLLPRSSTVLSLS
jgi:hypothetical protein